MLSFYLRAHIFILNSVNGSEEARKQSQKRTLQIKKTLSFSLVNISLSFKNNNRLNIAIYKNNNLW